MKTKVFKMIIVKHNIAKYVKCNYKVLLNMFSDTNGTGSRIWPNMKALWPKCDSYCLYCRYVMKKMCHWDVDISGFVANWLQMMLFYIVAFVLQSRWLHVEVMKWQTPESQNTTNLRYQNFVTVATICAAQWRHIDCLCY